MISYWKKIPFPDGPDDLFYARVRCLWDTYGPGGPADFWVQRIQENTTAWLCRCEDCLTISASPSADWEELAEFALFSGARIVFCPPGLVLPGAVGMQTGCILCRSKERLPVYSAFAPSWEVIINPPGGQLYALLSQCQSDVLRLPPRDGFLSDYMRRVRLKTGRARLWSRDGRDVSAVMTTAEAPGLAVIGGLAVLPQCRDQGLASAALGILTAELCREGRQVFLAAGNDDLDRFYEGRGFVRCGEWRLWQPSP